MPEEKAPVLEAAVPILSVSDLSEALDDYQHILASKLSGDGESLLVWSAFAVIESR